MSKFITTEEFKDGLNGIKGNLKNAVSDINDLFHMHDDLASKIDTLKEAININADGCQDLENEISSLSGRLDKCERSLRDVKTSLSAIDNQNGGTGIVIFLIAGAAIVGFLYLVSELDKLEKRINMLPGAKKAEEANAWETFQKDEPVCDKCDESTPDSAEAASENGKEN